MTNTFLLGDRDLTLYVTRNRISEERREYLERVLESTGPGLLDVELAPWQRLRAEQEGYHPINPEFLQMSGIVEAYGRKLRVPAFGVFRRSEQGFSGFSLEYSPGGQVIFRSSSTKQISLALASHLAMSTEIAHQSSRLRNSASYVDKTCFIFDFPSLWPRKGPAVRLETKFHGLIPAQTKERLKVADDIFKGDVYLVAEMKPNDWSQSRIREGDPLILGVTGDNKAYLVEHFDTTPFEDHGCRDFS